MAAGARRGPAVQQRRVTMTQEEENWAEIEAHAQRVVDAAVMSFWMKTRSY
jgi:hypothetical protein